MATDVQVSVLPDGHGFAVRDLPGGDAGPLVSIELGGRVVVLVSDADVMADLVHLIKTAEQQLHDLLNGADDRSSSVPASDGGGA